MIISAISSNMLSWNIVHLARVIGGVLMMAKMTGNYAMLENKYTNLENESYILLKMKTGHFVFSTGI